MNELKNRTRFPSTIATNKLDRLRHLSHETAVPMSRLMDEALDLLLEKREDTNPKSMRDRRHG